MLKYMIGIDIGTTHLKTCLIDEKLNIVKTACADNRPTAETDCGRCYDPTLFWGQVTDLLKQVTEVVTDGEILAIGITGMADTGLPVDEKGKPLYPIIPWNNNCGLNYKTQILKKFSLEELYGITGLPYHPKFALSRLLYLWENQKEQMQKMCYWLSIYSYTIHCLTGEFVTDETQACRTMLYNIKTHEWEPALTEFAKVTGKLPNVIGMGEIAGYLKPEIAKILGLSEKIAVVCGGHDHLCAMAAIKVEDGEIFNSQGTSEVFLGFASNDSDDASCLKRGICQGCFKNGKRYWLANLPSSGASVEWLRRLSTEESPLPYQIFEDESRLENSFGVMYLPMINGSGTPHPNPENTGLLLGLRSTTTIYHIVKAVYEGISYETRWIIDCIEEIFNQKIQRLVAVGGSTKNPILLQTRADVTGRIYHKTSICELPLYGAAIQAAEAVNLKLCNNRIEHCVATIPNENFSEQYNQGYHKYRALYENISPYLSINTRLP